MSVGESALGRAYRLTYEAICGRHPNVRPWHFQWLAGFYLYRGLRRIVPSISGRVLDAGCGEKPYREWFRVATEYVGLDVAPGPNVDVVVSPNEEWPLPDEHFDALISSQVLEHVENLEFTLGEMGRVLKPGGMMVLTVPFLYNEHGAPLDFRRFTVRRARALFPSWEVVLVESHGGIGSTIVILLLNWIDQSLSMGTLTRLLKAPLLPLWMLMSLGMNLAGLLVDQLDRTGAYYSSAMVVFRKVPPRLPL